MQDNHGHDFSGEWNELAYCVRCMTMEGGVPTDCPGYRLDLETTDAIYQGQLDYRGGQWVPGAISFHSPAYYRSLAHFMDAAHPWSFSI